MMHGREKSDPAIVAMKPTNKAGRPAAESVERRAGTKGNADQQSTRRAQNRESVSQALDRVRQAARQRKKERFTALFHHVNVDLLRTAFYALKRDAAPGVDGLTWQDYEADLEPQARGSARPGPSGSVPGAAVPADGTYRSRTAGSGRWRSPPWRTRSSRGATVAVLNAIYEEDFLGFSYGFRPGRGQHDALDALAVGITSTQGELDPGRRYPGVLRRGQPGMADPLPGAPDRRSAHHPPDPEMAEGGRPRRRGRDGQ